MKPLLLLAISLTTLTPAFGQKLSPGDAKLAETARGHYYNLQANGFDSMTCSVAFDLDTVPLIPLAADDPVRQLVSHTAFTLAIDGKGRPDVRHRFPSEAPEAQKQKAAQIIGLMTSLIGGLFQTWTSKGFQGPIPPFASEIASIKTLDNGYDFALNVPGAPVTVSLNKDFSVKQIISAHEKTHEYPTYKPSPEGLVFAGNKATDESSSSAPVKVEYQLDSAIIDGLHVPSAAHLRVNDNIDTRFSLRDCTVKKGIVLRTPPPA